MSICGLEIAVDTAVLSSYIYRMRASLGTPRA